MADDGGRKNSFNGCRGGNSYCGDDRGGEGFLINLFISIQRLSVCIVAAGAAPGFENIHRVRLSVISPNNILLVCSNDLQLGSCAQKIGGALQLENLILTNNRLGGM